MNLNQLAEGRCPKCSTALEIRDDDEQEPYGFCAECHCGWRLNTAADGSMSVDYVLIPRIPKALRQSPHPDDKREGV